MKRLNLNETWALCLKMWKWIAMKVRAARNAGRIWNVDNLKKEWLQKHGIKDEEIDLNCFFCEYDDKRHSLTECQFCPARKIERDFHCNKSTSNYACFDYDIPLPAPCNNRK